MFGGSDLSTLRGLVGEVGARAGLPALALDDLVLAASEVATNSLVYGEGTGVVRMWTEADDVMCEVEDAGVITDPLADRRRPGADPGVPRALGRESNSATWCRSDSSPERGTAVRLRMHTRSRGA